MFFTFGQNNSGGTFDIDHNVAHFVIIEADNADEANSIAESKGIYFDGCDLGQDCDCCGDRWYRQWKDDNGSVEPGIYGQNPQTYRCMFTPLGKPYCHIYYKDGLKRSFIAVTPGEQALIQEVPRLPLG